METSHIIESLVAVIFFALIFFFGPKLRLHGPGQLYHRRFLSFAAGVSVAYVFFYGLEHMVAWTRLRRKKESLEEKAEKTEKTIYAIHIG